MTDSGAPARIEFLDSHRPALESGEYRISLSQEVSAKGEGGSFLSAREFLVRGERFAISSSLVTAVFPPAGSLGDHSNVLPHLVLGRSTLPWERSCLEPADPPPNDPAQDPPWLALLLFDESEIPKPAVMPVSDLLEAGRQAAAGMSPRFPRISLEEGAQHEDDKVMVIDVPAGLLEKIAPSRDELSLLAHARQGTDEKGSPVGDEVAVLLCGRLPRPGATSTVHLVSVEGRYGADGKLDLDNAKNDEPVRLVTLKNWSFACADESKDFAGLLEQLSLGPNRPPRGQEPKWTAYLKTRRGKNGYLPVEHRLRQGGKTISVYRGPLLPGPAQAAPTPLPVRTSDELLGYDESDRVFDLSYAAAWELGRLMMLADKRVSTSLFQWKRSNRQHLAESEKALEHLAFGGREQPPFPDAVDAWFKDRALLRGVPFNYLVPDERLLPDESLRLFQLDGLWIDCLLDGAFSVGRVTGADHTHDADHQAHAANPHPPITGFLLRSEVVAGWPHLQADAAGPKDKKLEELRMDRLADNVLLGLYKGELATLDLHLKPEGMHFGLHQAEDAKGAGSGYYKGLRNIDTGDYEDDLWCPVAWRDDRQRVLDIGGLTAAIEKKLLSTPGGFTSAEFALEMIEGAEGLRFLAAEAKTE